MALQLHAGLSLCHPGALRPTAPRALALKRAAMLNKAGVLSRKVARPCTVKLSCPATFSRSRLS